MSSQTASLNIGNSSGFFTSQQSGQQSSAATTLPPMPAALQGSQWANGVIQGGVSPASRLERRSYQVQSDRLLTDEPELWHAPSLCSPQSLIDKLFGDVRDNQTFEMLKEIFSDPSQPDQTTQSHLNLLFGVIEDLLKQDFSKKGSYRKIFFLYQLQHAILAKRLSHFENLFVKRTAEAISKAIQEIVKKLSLEEKCQVVRFANLITYPNEEEANKFREAIKPLLYRVVREGNAYRDSWHSVPFILNAMINCLGDIWDKGSTSQFFNPLKNDLDTLTTTILPGSSNYLSYQENEIVAAAKHLQLILNAFQDMLSKGKEIQLPKYYHGTLSGNLHLKTVHSSIFELDIFDSLKALFEGAFVSTSFESNYGPPTLCFNFAVEWRKPSHILNFFSSGTQPYSLYKDEFWIGFKDGIAVKRVDLNNQVAAYNLAAIAVLPSFVKQQENKINSTIPVLDLRELRILNHLLRYFALFVPAHLPNEIKRLNPNAPTTTAPVAAVAPQPVATVNKAQAPTPKQTASRKRKSGSSSATQTSAMQSSNMAPPPMPGTVNPAAIFRPPPNMVSPSSTTSTTTTVTSTTTTVTPSSALSKTASSKASKKAKKSKGTSKSTKKSKGTSSTKSQKSLPIPFEHSLIEKLMSEVNGSVLNRVKEICWSKNSPTLSEAFFKNVYGASNSNFTKNCIGDGGIIYCDTAGRINAHGNMTLPPEFSLPQFMLVCIDRPKLARQAIIEGVLTHPLPLRMEPSDEGLKGELRSTYNSRKARYESAKILFPKINFPSPLRHLWDDMPKHTIPDGEVVGYNPFVTFNFMNVQTWLFESASAFLSKIKSKKNANSNLAKLLEDLEYTMGDSLEVFLSLLIIEILSVQPLPPDYDFVFKDYVDIRFSTPSRSTYAVRLNHNTFDKGEAHGRNVRRNPNEPVVLWQMLQNLEQEERDQLFNYFLQQPVSNERVKICAEFAREIGKAMTRRYFSSNETGRTALPRLLPNTPLTSLLAGSEADEIRKTSHNYLLP